MATIALLLVPFAVAATGMLITIIVFYAFNLFPGVRVGFYPADVLPLLITAILVLAISMMTWWQAEHLRQIRARYLKERLSQLDDDARQMLHDHHADIYDELHALMQEHQYKSNQKTG